MNVSRWGTFGLRSSSSRQPQSNRDAVVARGVGVPLEGRLTNYPEVGDRNRRGFWTANTPVFNDPALAKYENAIHTSHVFVAMRDKEERDSRKPSCDSVENRTFGL